MIHSKIGCYVVLIICYQNIKYFLPVQIMLPEILQYDLAKFVRFTVY